MSAISSAIQELPSLSGFLRLHRDRLKAPEPRPEEPDSDDEDARRIERPEPEPPKPVEEEEQPKRNEEEEECEPYQEPLEAQANLQERLKFSPVLNDYVLVKTAGNAGLDLGQFLDELRTGIATLSDLVAAERFR